MNSNFLRGLQENRSFLLVLLAGLILSALLWYLISLFFRPEPDELVLPFQTGTATPLTTSVIVSGTAQLTFTGFTPTVTNTGTITPIVASTFTPRSLVPATATGEDPTRPTSTVRPTSTRRPIPTATARPPTSTQRPPPAPTLINRASPTPKPTDIQPTTYP